MATAGNEPRFAFGENWRRFLSLLDEERIVAAERSLIEKFGRKRLDDLNFLDVGSGSGLFSLAAMRLGSAQVHSFDFDPASVACTAELRRRFFPDALTWTVERGDATDAAYVGSLGRFDIVYSWGVLHHTGAMWQAMENTAGAVAPGGTLFVAIYNDQGATSRRWATVKRTYTQMPEPLPRAMLAGFGLYFGGRSFLGSLLRRDLKAWRADRRGSLDRGMSRRHDLVDWVGGYPFEVAKPEELFDFCRSQGFELRKLKTCGGGLGCNEFVFERQTEAPSPG